MDYKRISINIDAATGKQIDTDGSVITSEASYMRLVYSEMCVVCVTFYDVTTAADGTRTLATHAIPSDATLSIMGDKDFDETTSLMFYSTQTSDDNNRVDVAGDWIGGTTADRSQGQISFRINTRTAKFIEVLTTAAYSNSNCYCAIDMIPAGSTSFSALASFKFTAVNRVTSEASAPKEDDPTYLTQAEIIALLKLAREYQYSADGTSWHSTQATSDRYYQERYPGGEWSASIALVVGPEGKAATVAVGTITALNYGNSPTVTNSGNSNAAVLNFGVVSGKAATVNVGTATLAEYGTAFSVTNSGTTSDAVLNVVMPKAPAPVVQYSVDGTTWLTEPTADTIYMRVSTDGGTTWQTAWRCRGYNGLGYTPRGAYDAATTYATDEVVTYNGNLYASIISSNTGNLPTDTNYWLRIVAGSGQASITIFNTIALRDAYVPAATGELAFVRDATGDSTVASGSAEYLWDGVNSVWIKVFEAESLDVVLSFAHLSGEVTDNAKLVAALAAKVDTSTTVNGHALTGNITVTASDLSLAAVASSGSATDLTTGTLPAARLPASGAVAGTYGSGTAIPTVTVDASGRVTAITTTSITVGSCDAPAAASVATSNYGLSPYVYQTTAFNDSSTVLFLKNSTTNTAASAVTVAPTITGTISTSGDYMVFDGSQAITYSSSTSPALGNVLATAAWTFDMLVTYTGTGTVYLGHIGREDNWNLFNLSPSAIYRDGVQLYTFDATKEFMFSVEQYGSRTNFYVNGTLIGYLGNSYAGTNYLVIGGQTGGTGFIGKIRSVRVSNIARYQSTNFTVPADVSGSASYLWTFPSASTAAITGAELISIKPTSSATTAVTHTVREIVGATPINAQTGTSYTLALTDQGKLVTMTNSAANVLTIPLNSAVAYPVGAWIDVQMLGAGITTLTAATGVTLNGTSAGTLALSQWRRARIIQTATNIWTAY